MKTRRFIIGFLLLAAGCAVPPVRVEKEERAVLARVEPIYRPAGEKPALPVLTDKSELKDFVRYALLNNPAVEARFYQWKSDLDTAAAARYLPAPALTLDMEISSYISKFEPGVIMLFPPRGKITLEAEAASVEARRSRRAFEEEILKTAFSVKKNAWSFWNVKQKEAARAEALSVLRELEANSFIKTETGTSSMAEVLRIQTEEAELTFALAELKDSENVIMAGFGAALGIAYGNPVPAPPLDLPCCAADFSEENIWASVQANNPGLAAYRDSVIKSEIFIKRAYKEYLPELEVTLMRTFFSDFMFTEPLLTLSLPWRDKVRTVISAAENASRKEKANLSAAELDLAVVMADALFRWRQANREVALHADEILPRLQAEFDLLMEKYPAGSASLTDILDSLQKIIECESACDAAHAQREIILNEISLLISGILPPEENIFKGTP